MWLIIIFILGTLCVIFNEKIGEFLSRIIDLDLIFLSIKEKKIKQQSRTNKSILIGVLLNILNSKSRKSIFYGCVLPDVVIYYDKIPQEVFSENLGLV